MSAKILKSVAILPCFVLFGIESSHADAKAHEFYFQQQQQRFVMQPQDARMFGLGGATTQTTANSLATVTNPAGLGLMKYGDVSATYGYNEISGNRFPSGGKLTDKQNSGQVYGATPINPVKDGLPDSGNLGLGWYGRYGNWTYDPDDTDTSTYQMSAAYGKAISDRLSVGYGLTYQNDDLNAVGYEYRSTNSFLHSIGMQYRDGEDLTFGSSISIGHGKHSLEYNSGRAGEDVDQFSATWAGGMEYRMGTTTVATGLDFSYLDNSGDDNNQVNPTVFGGDSHAYLMNARVGIEEQVEDWLAVRAGYRYAANFNWEYDRDSLSQLDGSAKYNAISAGAGVQYDFDRDSVIQAVRLDYGVEYRMVGENDWQHLVTVAAPFDICL
jgi:hypothetical protein